MLNIEDLTVVSEDKVILKGLCLCIKPGEIHAIMGPNGAGKSTLAKVLAGHPSYEVTSGTITFCGQDLLALAPEERALLGLFMSFQYPIEITGISNLEFLMSIYNAQRKARNEALLSEAEFLHHLKPLMEKVHIPLSFLERDLNSGFSGGEKKKNEILQMAVLEPICAILDETDSGLDIDAMRIVADGVNFLMNPSKGLLLITHYQRLLDYIKPDYVHVLIDGKIVMSGDSALALTLEEKGYDWLHSHVE